MSNKDIDHKQLIVAKCYELALIDCRDGITEARSKFVSRTFTMTSHDPLMANQRLLRGSVSNE
jgi:hypothetical protein